MSVIMAHLGGMAWLNEGLALLGYHDNLYCDLTGAPARLAPEWFASFACLTPLNWERVVFGTDSMIGDFEIPYQAYLEKMKHFKLDDNAINEIMGKRMAEIIDLPPI
jgi:predicted TIM-barrel fold metal-dependent hydrolase